MPWGDGTGPQGEGPLTGWGRGPCAQMSYGGRGYYRRYSAGPLGFGFGRGWGSGRGFGRGRGGGFGRGFRGRGFGFGRGFGRGGGFGRGFYGRGFGFGRGYDYPYYNYPYNQSYPYYRSTAPQQMPSTAQQQAPSVAPQPTKEEELKDLKAYAGELKSELDGIMKRVSELEKG